MAHDQIFVVNRNAHRTESHDNKIRVGGLHATENTDALANVNSLAILVHTNEANIYADNELQVPTASTWTSYASDCSVLG